LTTMLCNEMLCFKREVTFGLHCQHPNLDGRVYILKKTPESIVCVSVDDDQISGCALNNSANFDIGVMLRTSWVKRFVCLWELPSNLLDRTSK
jgi:hypothetical protein